MRNDVRSIDRSVVIQRNDDDDDDDDDGKNDFFSQWKILLMIGSLLHSLIDYSIFFVR